MFGQNRENLEISNYGINNTHDKIIAELINGCKKLKKLNFSYVPNFPKTLQHLILSNCSMKYQLKNLIISLPELQTINPHNTTFEQKKNIKPY